MQGGRSLRLMPNDTAKKMRRLVRSQQYAVQSGLRCTTGPTLLLPKNISDALSPNTEDTLNQNSSMECHGIISDEELANGVLTMFARSLSSISPTKRN